MFRKTILRLRSLTLGDPTRTGPKRHGLPEQVHVKIKVYVIDCETPRWLRKTIACAVPLAVVLGAATLVLATPQQWTAGQTLQAIDLNKLSVVTNGSSKYSVGATAYCGTGPTNTTGAISYNGKTGYAGAKAMCEASSACGNSATAHMCTSDELVRSAQLGMTPVGWYSSGYDVTNVAGYHENDCGGWTSNGSYEAAAWGPNPGFDLCGHSNPVLCCD
jgi:hypothetical protein